MEGCPFVLRSYDICISNFTNLNVQFLYVNIHYIFMFLCIGAPIHKNLGVRSNGGFITHRLSSS